MFGGCYGYEGEPLEDFRQWAILFADEERRVVGFTALDGVEVSTVWLGLDYSIGPGPPLIYETMIFGGPHDERQWRYPNRDAALAGHDQAVALARDAVEVPR